MRAITEWTKYEPHHQWHAVRCSDRQSVNELRLFVARQPDCVPLPASVRSITLFPWGMVEYAVEQRRLKVLEELYDDGLDD